MKRFFIAVNVSYLSCGFVLMVNSIRLGERTRKEKITPQPHARRPVADEQAAVGAGRDMFSYFIEFCGLEEFEHRWGAIYVELMYRYIRRITCTYVDSVG